MAIIKLIWGKIKKIFPKKTVKKETKKTATLIPMPRYRVGPDDDAPDYERDDDEV